MTKPKAPPVAADVIDAMAGQPTLDELMRRDPSDLSKEDRTTIIARQREDRVAFMEKESKAAAKKEGAEDT